MKKILLIALLFSAFIANSQSFTGKGDQKFFIGANLQNNASGLNIGYDYGLGENFSIGVNSTYALNVYNGVDKAFIERFDLKARFNANLGNVVNISENLDFYPGLSLSLKNFGGHFGMRYFFTSGFGIYSEFNTPLAKYDTDRLTPAEKIHNQFTVNIGAIFNL
ncbi:DUF6646 family protein [Bizionia paragorgiae]|jgi:outer membrane protein G|uniref:DUF6646 family protein n=1 Tax=Bizionia paragorgiae TaxID=283786 RepID=UPI00299D09DA|nr:DUF6646 family protein [Bizionia paragorgiae]MDX1271607.1 DUF6646 family protein [Bizionia paragorgiae]